MRRRTHPVQIGDVDVQLGQGGAEGDHRGMGEGLGSGRHPVVLVGGHGHHTGTPLLDQVAQGAPAPAVAHDHRSHRVACEAKRGGEHRVEAQRLRLVPAIMAAARRAGTTVDFTDSVSAMRASGRSAPASRPMATSATGSGTDSRTASAVRTTSATSAPGSLMSPRTKRVTTVGGPGDGAVDDDDVVARFLQPLGEQ